MQIETAFRSGSLFSPLLSIKGRRHLPDDAAPTYSRWTLPRTFWLRV